jgi:hypothetical protein
MREMFERRRKEASMEWRVERAAKLRAVMHAKTRKAEQRTKRRRSEFDAFSEGHVPSEKLQLFQNPKYQKPEETSDGEIKILHEHLCGPRDKWPVDWYIQRHAFDIISSEKSTLNPNGTESDIELQQPSFATHPPEQLQDTISSNNDTSLT